MSVSTVESSKLSRLLFLSPVGVLGGAERLLLDLIASLKECAPLLRMKLVSATDGPLLDEAAAMGVDVSLVQMPDALAVLGDSGLQPRSQMATLARMLSGVGREGVEAVRYLRELQKIVRAFEPELVHSNGIKSHLLAPFVVPASTPVVWHVHDFLGQRPVMRKALRLLRSRASLAVANSHAVGRDVEQVLPGMRVRVVPNAVDVQRFSPGTGDGQTLDSLAELPPAPNGTVRVGLIATFARWKGQDVFLRAAARLLAQVPSTPVRFYIVGGPIYRTTDSQFEQAELVRMADSLGLQGRVGFLGFRRDVADVYRALDVVVHASVRPEPFGLTIAEAMACGRPVLVAAAGGAAELFTHPVDAWGYPPGDVIGLSSSLRTLISNQSLRDSIAERARLRAELSFSRSRLGPEMLRAYASLRTAEAANPEPRLRS